MSNRSTMTAAATALAACSVMLSGVAPSTAAIPASGPADTGLYGSQDPTYDGVYRQSLAIIGLAAADRRVPKRAGGWLVDQQCRNGSFQAYRPDPEATCDKSDPVSFTGPDTNSTATAAMALYATDDEQRAGAAIRWLRRVQNPDGGFPFVKGGDADANSTGLSLAAIRAARPTAANTRVLARGEKFLSKLQLRCSAKRSMRGLLSFQAEPETANDLATVQAALGLITTLPIRPAELPDAGGPIRCRGGKATGRPDVASAALAAVKKRLKATGGLLPSGLGAGSDPSATAQAVLALVAADIYPKQSAKAARRLAGVADTYTGVDEAAVPGALGTLLMVAAATDLDPRDFGGVDLVKVLAKSRR